MTKTNNIYSIYLWVIYLALLALFLYFHEMLGFKLDYSEVSVYIIKERATYYILSAFLFLQIYLVSIDLYIKLINTISLISFLFMFIQPLNDILLNTTQVWILSSINLFLILLMQTEKYYYK
ncbi:MAG: hypothetical protein ACJ0P8_00765 [Flavobacteriales bacterium]